MDGRRKGAEAKAIERKEYAGISRSCIQPQAAATELNVGECERVREREGGEGGANYLEGT